MPTLRVSRKQPNSRMCLVCGRSNTLGLHAEFFELENGELAARFTGRPEHQSYPGRMHGGIATAILDETIGRAIMIGGKHEVWGVTLGFSIALRKSLPLGVELTVVGRVSEDTARTFTGTGEILLPDGSIAASGTGTYLKLPIERITEFDISAEEWSVSRRADDPAAFELPDLSPGRRGIEKAT